MLARFFGRQSVEASTQALDHPNNLGLERLVFPRFYSKCAVRQPSEHDLKQLTEDMLCSSDISMENYEVLSFEE